VQDSVALFRAEYDRVNRELYAGALPPFPGVLVTDRRDLFSLTTTLGRGPSRRLMPFELSRHVRGPLLREAILHAIAHAAALLLDEDEGHGPAWRAHAARIGARATATLDRGDHLRAEWDAD
jgi:hypothetical protein